MSPILNLQNTRKSLLGPGHLPQTESDNHTIFATFEAQGIEIINLQLILIKLFELADPNSVIVRETAISGQADHRPVKPNFGIKPETGFMFDRGVEAKLDGAGLKIASDSVEIGFLCLIRILNGIC